MPLQPPDETGYFRVELEGACYTIPRYCPHRAGRLDHGHINPVRHTVSCPLHRSVFCLNTGKQLSGPPCGDLEMAPCENTQAPLAYYPDPKTIQSS